MRKMEEIHDYLNGEALAHPNDEIELDPDEWANFLMTYSDSILSQYFSRGLLHTGDGRLFYAFRGVPVLCRGREFIHEASK